MSNGNSSYLRFSVEESIWFQKGHEVEELVSISLSPNVVIQETREYVLIKGSLELTGEYQSKLDMLGQPEVPAPGEKFMEILEVRNDGVCFFRYFFPVDITIRREKIANVHQVDFLVDNFDYTFPERSCLKLSANLFVTGLLEEALPKPEFQTFTQPAFFQPEAQVPRLEKYIPIPETTVVVKETTREEVEVGEELEELIVEQAVEAEFVIEELVQEEERVEISEDVTASKNPLIEEEIARLQVEEIDALLQPLEENASFEEIEIDVVFEDEIDVEVVYEEDYELEEKVVEFSSEDQIEEVLLQEEVEEVIEQEQEELVENEIQEQVVDLVEELEDLVEEIITNPVMVEEAPKKSAFGFDIFLSKKFNKKNENKVEEPSVAEMKEDKKKAPPVKLTEFLGNKANDGNINLKIYFIQPNDTLEKIAERYGTPLTQLLRYNKLDSAVDLVPGEILYVPRTTVKK